MNILKTSRGFTLIELMIVVAIVGILAAIAYPSYQRYVINTKRGDMMTEMQNIATSIESQKLAQGTYKKVELSKVLSGYNVAAGNAKYPTVKDHLYNVKIEPVDTTKTTHLGGSDWKIIATPVNQMANDGTLTLNHAGQKCRIIASDNKKCGAGNEWRD